jgi:hypothetical protein
MKRSIIAMAISTLCVVAAIGALALVGSAAPAPKPPAVGRAVPMDSGAGEMLLVVLGGVFPSRAEAEAANAAVTFGDLEGYYVVPVAQFQGFREQVVAAGDFALVSVFRTDVGAQQFAAFARSLGYQATVLPNRVRSLGGVYAGLGQEAAPDGIGPLFRPVPASLP